MLLTTIRLDATPASISAYLLFLQLRRLSTSIFFCATYQQVIVYILHMSVNVLKCPQRDCRTYPSNHSLNIPSLVVRGTRQIVTLGKREQPLRDEGVYKFLFHAKIEGHHISLNLIQDPTMMLREHDGVLQTDGDFIARVVLQ
jgi:hypothetical protein